MADKYELLRRKDIIAILDGDVTIEGKEDTSSWRKKNLGGGKLGLEEKGMKYYWINAWVKNPEERFDGKIIEDIKKGVYIDVDKYEYVIPENKWKSEPIVYEIVK